MSRQPPYTFSREFEPPGHTFKVPAKLAKKLPEVVGAGLYKAYIAADFQDGHEPLNELNFPSVKTHADLPELDTEQIAQLILAVCYDHNFQVKRQSKYRVRFKEKREQGPSVDSGYCTFSLNAAMEYDDQSTAVAVPESPSAPPAPRMPAYGGGGPMDYGEVVTDPMMLFMQHLSLLMHEQRLWQAEMRMDVQKAREHAENAHEKLYDVVTKNLAHTEAQGRVNQAGWDALQRGVDMQAGMQQRDWGYWQEIQKLNNQIILLEQQKSQSSNNGGFIQQFLPIIAMGLMPKMGAMGPMLMGMMQNMMGGQMPQLGAPPEPEDDDGDDDDGGDDGGGQVVDVAALDRMTLRDVASMDEVRASPIKVMCRLLNRIITPDERANIQTILTPEEWSSLQQVLAAPDDQQCAFALFTLAGQIDNSRQKRLMGALRPRPRKLLNDIGTYAQQKFQGQNPSMPQSASTPAPEPPPQPTAATTPAGQPMGVVTGRGRIDTRYCGSCGQPNPSAFRFCGGCGTAFAADRPGVPDLRGPIASRAAPPEPELQASPPPPPPPPPPEPDEPEELEPSEPNESEEAEPPEPDEPEEPEALSEGSAETEVISGESSDSESEESPGDRDDDQDTDQDTSEDNPDGETEDSEGVSDTSDDDEPDKSGDNGSDEPSLEATAKPAKAPRKKPARGRGRGKATKGKDKPQPST